MILATFDANNDDKIITIILDEYSMLSCVHTDRIISLISSATLSKSLHSLTIHLVCALNWSSRETSHFYAHPILTPQTFRSVVGIEEIAITIAISHMDNTFDGQWM